MGEELAEELGASLLEQQEDLDDPGRLYDPTWDVNEWEPD